MNLHELIDHYNNNIGNVKNEKEYQNLSNFVQTNLFSSIKNGEVSQDHLDRMEPNSPFGELLQNISLSSNLEPFKNTLIHKFYNTDIGDPSDINQSLIKAIKDPYDEESINQLNKNVQNGDKVHPEVWENLEHHFQPYQLSDFIDKLKNREIDVHKFHNDDINHLERISGATFPRESSNIENTIKEYTENLDLHKNHLEKFNRAKNLLNKNNDMKEKINSENDLHAFILKNFPHDFLNIQGNSKIFETPNEKLTDAIKHLKNTMSQPDFDEMYQKLSFWEKAQYTIDQAIDPNFDTNMVNKLQEMPLNRLEKFTQNYPQLTGHVMSTEQYKKNPFLDLCNIRSEHLKNETDGDNDQSGNHKIDNLPFKFKDKDANLGEFHDIPYEAQKLLNKTKELGGKINAKDAQEIYKDNYPVKGKVLHEADLINHLNSKFPKRKYLSTNYNLALQRVNEKIPNMVFSPIMNEEEQNALGHEHINSYDKNLHPQTKDGLGWVRYHVDHNKKKIFIEEIQHDWGKDGHEGLRSVISKGNHPKKLLHMFLSHVHQKGLGHYDIKMASPEVVERKGGTDGPKAKIIYEDLPKKMKATETNLDENDLVDKRFHGQKAWKLN